MFLVLCSVSCEAFFSAFSNHLFSFFLLQNDMHLNAIAYILLSTPSCHITLFDPHVKQKLVLFLSIDLQLHMGILFSWSHKTTIFAMGKCFSFLIIFDISHPRNVFIFLRFLNCFLIVLSVCHGKAECCKNGQLHGD